MSDNRIHIFGASGSGISTLGRALSKNLGIPNFDFDDYYWMDTDPPFTTKRSPEKRLELLLDDIGNGKSYIISGHYGDYMDTIDKSLTLAIFIYTPKELRQERLRGREMAEFGDRILKGGDMHKNFTNFLEWATHYEASDMSGRNLQRHITRILNLECPVLKLNGKEDTIELVNIIKSYLV